MQRGSFSGETFGMVWALCLGLSLGSSAAQADDREPQPVLGAFYSGDSYSFAPQLGALIDGEFRCFSVHGSGMDDNTVLFDGVTENLDPYVDGTQPAVFEFESNSFGDTADVFINVFANDDLFPEGFEDPETGTPLDSACVEIGIDDTLDGNTPVEVTQALFEASNADGTVIPPIDITSFFSNPWDGRLSIVFPGRAGAGIDGMVLELTIQQAPFDPQPIFADGFESGDTTSWTDQSP